MGDMDSDMSGVGRDGVTGIERDVEGDECRVKGDDDTKGRYEGIDRERGEDGDNKGRDENNGDDKGRGECNCVTRDFEVGDLGRGRIRRELCVEGTVCGSAIGGTAGKGRRRAGVTFFIDEAPGNILLSI